MGIKRIDMGHNSSTTTELFTPVMDGATTAGTGTYTTQSGTATRSGDVVTIRIIISTTAHSGTGQIKITGIPAGFRPKVATPVVVTSDQLSATSTTLANISTDGTMLIYSWGNGSSWTSVSIDGACTIYVCGSYIA